VQSEPVAAEKDEGRSTDKRVTGVLRVGERTRRGRIFLKIVLDVFAAGLNAGLAL
jgi:hypothetical protein